MANRRSSEKQCATCSNGRARCHCLGCERQFCLDCMRSHQSEIEGQLDHLIQERDQLYDSFNDPESIQKHPLMFKIKKWEDDSVSRIRRVAAETRDRLRNILEEVKTQFDSQLKELSSKLVVVKQTKNFIEEGKTQKLFHERLFEEISLLKIIFTG